MNQIALFDEEKNELAVYDTIASQLEQASNDFERLSVRDDAEKAKTIALIYNRKDLAIKFSNLMMDAEREIAKANPPAQGNQYTKKVEVTPGVTSTLDKKTLSVIRKAHSIPDDVYTQQKQASIEEGEPLTRAKLIEGAKKSEKAKAKDARTEHKKEIAKLPPVSIDNFQLHHCAIDELHKHVPAQSIDTIVTDPPYPKENLDCWTGLRNFAMHALKPDGLLVAMSGQMFLPEVIARLHCAHLHYRWTLCCYLKANGGTYSNPQRGVQRNLWKPVLVYGRKPDAWKNAQFTDYYTCEAPDKNSHEWGQAVDPFVELLEMIHTQKDSTICDPFLGGGTTALAAHKIGCGFVGADIKKECIDITNARLQGETQCHLP